jgi:penicillin-binding protein 1C
LSPCLNRPLRFVRAHVRVAAGASAVCLLAVALWVPCGPIPPALLDFSDATSTVVVDRHGVPLYEALSGDGARSLRMTADALPPALTDATVAAEDRRFWSHPGVDVFAMARAAGRNLRELRIVEGGSTITQQVAKLLLARRSPGRVRGVADKVVETVLALRLERRFSKREILAMYLNLAAYGNQIVGAGRASRAYFGRDASVLTPAQAALLAGLTQRPSTFNPYRRLDAALQRQRVIVHRMEAAGLLTAAGAREAQQERLTLTADTAPFLAPHFVEMVLSSLDRSRPARVETTIDAGLQADVAGIIGSHRAMLTRHGAGNVAVVVLDNARSEWLAWEGSADYGGGSRGGQINGPLVPRQPGSALKPFTYALAFEEGVTPASVLPDVPSHFPTAEPGILYSPRNYDGRYRGPLLARRALAGSENVPAVALASRLGVPRLLRFLARGGLSTFDQNASFYGLGVTLGNAEVRLDELVAAYAAFARGGRWVRPTWQRTGSAQRPEHPLVSPRTAFWITDILSDGEAREFIFGRGGHLEFPFPVAVKTGTSQAYHDNWTIGYTRDVTVGVWVGNFDRSPLRDSTGVTGAGPIFHAVMLAAVARGKPAGHFGDPAVAAARPDGLLERRVCALSGMAANEWCPSRQREWLPAGDDKPCDWHRHTAAGVQVAWPAGYRAWAAQQDLLEEAPPVRASAAALPDAQSAREGGPALAIANPPSGATYSIDPTLRREFQTLALRAVAQENARIDWHIDDHLLGSTSAEVPLMWPLRPGTHRIVARDRHGHSAETTISVR